MSGQEKENKPAEMLNANQAGGLLGVSGKTVIRLMEAGEFPGYKIGGVWKFRRGEIEAYIEAQRYKPSDGDGTPIVLAWAS